MDDSISRQAAINALWKALFDYEDSMEKQFIGDEKLKAEDWLVHRIFVENMSDIDRKTILELPSVQPEHRITLESAIDYLYQTGWMQEHDKLLSETAEAVKEIIKCQKLVDEQPEQKWIPCNWHKENENLPDEGKSVVICIEGGCIDVSYRMDYNRWERYGWVKVIAWMPLPEPYQEKGVNDNGI